MAYALGVYFPFVVGPAGFGTGTGLGLSVAGFGLSKDLISPCSVITRFDPVMSPAFSNSVSIQQNVQQIGA
jgi:hypothetical protein